MSAVNGENMEENVQALVEENVRLVYFVFGKMTRSELISQYREDLISEGFLGLVKAAQKFDESRGIKFVSFAAKCIRNQMFMSLRKLRKQTEHETSLDAPIGMDEDGHELCLLDILDAPPPQFVDERLDFQAFMKSAEKKDWQIIRAKLLGYTQKEIGELLNLSQSYVARRYHRLCERFQAGEKAV